MSASTHQPPLHGREGGTGRACGAFGQSGPLPKVLLAGFLLTALLAGCSTDGSIATNKGPSPTTASPSTSPTGVDEQQAILEPYRKFWASLTPVSSMPAAERRAALTPFTVDPELKSLLAGMARTDARKQVFYGADVPRASKASISPDGSRAVVDDCQDSSQAGNAERATGKRLTYGSKRNHVVTTMLRVAGTWKVYFVSYSKTTC